ncbi:MAG: amidohydrolase family protein [Proteobacteria bacterium]|nr:amidohydrolase family protein [Pseudomonadota bacterium]
MGMLFEGGAIFDGEVLQRDGWAALIEGETIAEVGPCAAFDGYGGPRRDIAGLTLLPGLIDAHAHLTLSGTIDGFSSSLAVSRARLTLSALENAQACLQGGITALRDCGGVDHVELAVRDACNSGRHPGPTIRAAGKFICMTGGANYSVARIADGPTEIVAAVREQIHVGCDCIKLMATGGVLTPGNAVEQAHYTCEELAVGVREAKRFAKPVASHAIGAAGALNAARAGVDSIEHGVFLTDECIREMLARQIFLVPTLAATTNIMANLQNGFSAEVREKVERAAQSHRRSVKAYHDAGGRIAMGADTGTPFNPHGRNAQELRYMVDAGMSPVAALTAATVNGAALLQLPTRGRIRKGCIADLLLVAGDPTRDIECVADRTNHRGVFKSGAPVALASVLS